MDIFDKTIALEQAGGNAELAKDLFGMLLNDLPNMQSLLNDSFTGEKTQAFWDIAHKIHGSTAYCGTPRLKHACKLLEDAIKDDQKSDMELHLAGVNKEITLLLENGTSLLSDM